MTTLTPENPGELLHHAMQLHQQGALNDADHAYSNYLDTVEDDIQALRLHGILKREMGDAEGSLDIFQKLTDSSPDNFAAFNEIALTYMSIGQLQDADAALEHSLFLAPGNPLALINKGALLQFRGHAKTACELYRAVLDSDPEDLEVRCNLAKSLADAGNTAEALSEIDAALEESDEHPFILSIKASILADSGEHDQAIPLFQRVLPEMPDDENTRINLGYSYQLTGNQSEAMILWREAVDLNPHNARAVSDLAYGLIESGDAAQAEHLCDGFLLRHPGEPMVLAAHGYASVASSKNTPLFDYNDLITSIDLTAPEGYESIDAFNDDLIKALQDDESKISNPVNKSTYGGIQTGELELSSDPAYIALGDLVNQHIRATAEHWFNKLPQHPVLARIGQDYMIRAWGTLLNPGGKQTAHIHPMAWMSGVYYVSVPEEINEQTNDGWIEFGTPPERHRIGGQLGETFKPELIQPKAGRMVLFPSYMYHQTQPFQSESQRISIAFDAVPLNSMAMF